MLSKAWEVYVEFDRLHAVLSEFDLDKWLFSDLIFVCDYYLLYLCVVSISFYFDYFMRVFKGIFDILSLENVYTSILDPKVIIIVRFIVAKE